MAHTSASMLLPSQHVLKACEILDAIEHPDAEEILTATSSTMMVDLAIAQLHLKIAEITLMSRL